MSGYYRYSAADFCQLLANNNNRIINCRRRGAEISHVPVRQYYSLCTHEKFQRNTNSSSHVHPNQALNFSVSANTKYPIKHCISNEGNIPDKCLCLNFTLTASSDAGTSAVGFTTGGFAIGTHFASLCINVSVYIINLLVTRQDILVVVHTQLEGFIPRR